MRQIRSVILAIAIGLFGVGLVTGVWARDKNSTSTRSSPPQSVPAAVQSVPPQENDRLVSPTKPSGQAPTVVSNSTPFPAAPAAMDSAQGPSVVIPTRPTSPDAYSIEWQLVNVGSVAAAGGAYAANATVGQAAIGYATGATYAVGAGYWYGASATGGGCSCPYQCDYDENTFLDAIDLNGLIDALFFGGPNPLDPDCPVTRGDFDNSGFPDAIDLNGLIDHLFFGGPPPVDPCN